LRGFELEGNGDNARITAVIPGGDRGLISFKATGIGSLFQPPTTWQDDAPLPALCGAIFVLFKARGGELAVLLIAGLVLKPKERLLSGACLLCLPHHRVHRPELLPEVQIRVCHDTLKVPSKLLFVGRLATRNLLIVTALKLQDEAVVILLKYRQRLVELAGGLM